MKSSDKMFFNTDEDRMEYHGDFFVDGDMEIYGDLKVDGCLITHDTEVKTYFKDRILKTKWDLFKALVGL